MHASRKELDRQTSIRVRVTMKIELMFQVASFTSHLHRPTLQAVPGARRNACVPERVRPTDVHTREGDDEDRVDVPGCQLHVTPTSAYAASCARRAAECMRPGKS